MGLLKTIEKKHIQNVFKKIFKDQEGKEEVDLKKLDEFSNRGKSVNIGDLVKVHYKIIENKKERIQIFEGNVIAFKGKGLTRTVKVRKLSYGIGVERTFPLFSPNVVKIELEKRGKVRRAKLYYLRERSGKSAVIREKINFKKHEAALVAKAEKAAAKVKNDAAYAANKEAIAKEASPKEPTTKA
jgi:large subunit ribosomal protein L19